MAEAKSFSVLYIEDDQEMADLVAIVLKRREVMMHHALDGNTGLEMAAALHPDLILLDLMMPGLDGWSILYSLKVNSITYDIPVVIISAKAHGIDRFIGLNLAGADAYITKPFHPDLLQEVIDKYLQ